MNKTAPTGDAIPQLANHCGTESVRFNDLQKAATQSLRVAINAITELDVKFGSRIYLWELSSALAKIDGLDLILLVGRGQLKEVPGHLRALAREVAVSPGRSYLQIFNQSRIRQALLQEKIDIYHLPNTLPMPRKTVPTVVTIHDLAELRVKKYGLIRTGYRLLVNLFAAHFSDRILTVSESSKRDIVRLLHVPESKVKVALSGVTEGFRPLDRGQCSNYLKSKYSIEGRFLLAPGGLNRNKNVSGLLAAMNQLKQMGRPESLVLLGNTDSPEFAYVRECIRQSGLDGTVILPGFVPREELPLFYNAASLVIYPTLYEGFGLPVVEAMACGTPLVSSNVSSVPEIAGDAALLVNPGNPCEISAAAQRLLTDESLRAELIHRGLAQVQQFTWDRVAEMTLKVFLEMAKNK